MPFLRQLYFLVVNHIHNTLYIVNEMLTQLKKRIVIFDFVLRPIRFLNSENIGV